MKKTMFLLWALALFFPAAAFSQVGRAPETVGSCLLSAADSGREIRGQDGKFRENMSGLRIRKLVGYLGLTDEEVARVKPAVKALEQNRKQQMEDRNQSLDALASLLKNNAPATEIRNAVAGLQAREKEFLERDRELTGNVLSLLSPEQQAKYFLFNRYFAGEVRKSLYQMAGNREQKRSRPEGNQPPMPTNAFR